jgi:hypothetical protein
MTLTSGEVRVAGTGELFLGPVGTALPVDASVAIDPAFKGYGYTTQDGVVLSKSITREGIMAWQSSVPVRYITTEQEFTVQATFLQSNEDVMKVWLQSSDFAGSSGKYKADVPVDPPFLQYALVLEWKDGALVSRLTMAKCSITETGDVNIARQAVQFPVTFGALAPDTGTVLASWLTTDAAFGP